MHIKKQFAIKRKYDHATNKYWYFPVHSYIGLIWSYFEEDTGETIPAIGMYGIIMGTKPVYKRICFDDIEDAKAYIGKIIFESKTEEERKELLIKLDYDKDI